ncbi:hypothetical protein L195_g023082 [Trifolium pratense]|uniref:Uncharacterized protein n=1 Tax=Trifolium pratense TaxID=57577 RepID=A0A2K3N9V3_TRIPR|nr:hypothetical protein L195_g023082 [Trifolium pratense]
MGGAKSRALLRRRLMAAASVLTAFDGAKSQPLLLTSFCCFVHRRSFFAVPRRHPQPFFSLCHRPEQVLHCAKSQP